MAKSKDGVRIRVPGKNGKAVKARGEHVEIELGRSCILIVRVPDPAQPLAEIVVESPHDDARIEARQLADNALGVYIERVGGPAVSSFSSKVPVLELSVQKALGEVSKALSPKKHRIRRWAQAALQGERGAAVTVRLVDEAEGRALNRDFRGKDYPTNVLTFVYDDESLVPGGDVQSGLAGDVVLCVPVIAREAVMQGKTLDAHFAHLVVHGMLHLQGFDHEAPDEAQAMEALEAGVLASLGYADPYA